MSHLFTEKIIFARFQSTGFMFLGKQSPDYIVPEKSVKSVSSWSQLSLRAVSLCLTAIKKPDKNRLTRIIPVQLAFVRRCSLHPPFQARAAICSVRSYFRGCITDTLLHLQHFIMMRSLPISRATSRSNNLCLQPGHLIGISIISSFRC